MLEETGSEERLAPVVHETLEILEKHVLVFVQEALDGISVRNAEGESESNQDELPKVVQEEEEGERGKKSRY